ncbi:hypothetical protein OAJ78_02485 [Gammaproteobacteria bacterium]|nr:hypothetical protein [Gammaproteobacteria bacterium]
MVTGLLLFLARYLALARIGSKERKLRVAGPFRIFSRQRQRQRLETSAATDYREMAGRELTLPALRAGAEYDDIHQMILGQMANLNITMTTP